MATKLKTETPAVTNTLGKLVLEHLHRAQGNMIPESTLKTGLKNMVRPEADDEDFENAFIILLRKDVVQHEEDHVTGERKFFLTERGRTYLRDI